MREITAHTQARKTRFFVSCDEREGGFFSSVNLIYLSRQNYLQKQHPEASNWRFFLKLTIWMRSASGLGLQLTVDCRCIYLVPLKTVSFDK